MGVVTAPEVQIPETSAESPAVVRVRAPWLERLAGWLSSPLNLFLTLLALVPIVLVVLFILDRGNNMPYWDEWGNGAIIAVKTASGALRFEDIVRQNYDHRLFFSNLLTVLTTLLTGWNLHVEMLVSVGLALGMLSVLLLMARRHNRRGLAAVVLPFSALIFSLRHGANWLWGQQSSWFFTIFFLLAALWLVQARPRTLQTVLLAGALAFGSTFSTLHGFVTWVAIAALMVMVGYRSPRHYAVLLGMMVLAIILYSSNYDFGMLGANEDGNGAGLVKNPVNIILYTIAYLGNPFVPTRADAALPASLIGVAGLLLVALNAVALWRQNGSLRAAAPWLSLTLWCGGVALLTALGRGHVYPQLVPQQPLLDRYALPATMLWIALIAVASQGMRRASKIRLGTFTGNLTVANVVLLVILIPSFLFANFVALTRDPLISDADVECMLRFQAVRNTRCLAFTYLKQTPLVDVVDRVNEMARYRLAAFAGREPLYTDVIPLYHVDRMTTQDGGSVGFKFYDLSESQQYIAFQQPAPSQSEFTVAVPASETPVYVGGGVTLDTTALDRPPAGDGVLFRVGVRSPSQGNRLMGEIVYDPTRDSGLKAFRFNLDAYRGETIQLILQTSHRDNAQDDLGLWIDPIVFVTPG